jgi:putative transcriptional regulator
MKRSFDKIASGLNDAIGFAEEETDRGRVARNVKAVRARTGLTQGEFAVTYGLPLGTLRDWEQGRRTPDAGSTVLLKLIDRDHVTMRELVSED